MSPLKRSNNIAARMGRWSASHWKTAVFGWLAFVVAAVAIGMTVGTKNIKIEDANVGQSHKADQILKQGFPQADPQTEIVLVQSATLTVDDPAFRATVDDVVARGRGQSRRSKNLRSPLDRGNGDQISNDRRTVDGHVGHEGHVRRRAEEDRRDRGARRRRSRARHPGFFVGEAGSISSGKALDKMFNDQLKLAGERSIPITIIVLLLVFGALVAVGVPLLLALSGVHRDDRPRRAAEPPRPDGSERQRRDPAHRARRRRRLLALLPQARARGAGGRQGLACRARGRRGDLGPLGADLRLHRDDRDGRDALLRRQDATWASASPR